MSVQRVRLSKTTNGVAAAVGAGLLAAAVAGGLFAVGRGDARWAVATGTAVGVAVATGAALFAAPERIPWAKLRKAVAPGAAACALGLIAWTAGAASAGRLAAHHMPGALLGVALLAVAAAVSRETWRRLAGYAFVLAAAAAAVAFTAWDDLLPIGAIRLIGPWPPILAAVTLLAVVAVADATIKSGDTKVTGDAAGKDSKVPSDRAAQFRRRGIRGVYVGKDGRVSTSKLQVALWTGTVLFVLVHLYVQGRCLGSCSPADLMGLRDLREAWTSGLRPEYWALLGFPAGTAAYAKALSGRRAVHKAAITATEQGGGFGQGVREATMDDLGFVDIGDLQYFVFTLFAIGFVLVQFLADPQSGFPEVPGTLLGLVGVSSAAYGVKKAVTTDVGPEIRTVLPSELIVGEDERLEIRGEGFLLPGEMSTGQEKVVLAGRELRPCESGACWVKSVDFRSTVATLTFGTGSAQAFLKQAGITVEGTRLVTTVRVHDGRGIPSPDAEIVVRLPASGAAEAAGLPGGA